MDKALDTLISGLINAIDNLPEEERGKQALASIMALAVAAGMTWGEFKTMIESR